MTLKGFRPNLLLSVAIPNLPLLSSVAHPVAGKLECDNDELVEPNEELVSRTTDSTPPSPPHPIRVPFSASENHVSVLGCRIDPTFPLSSTSTSSSLSPNTNNLILDGLDDVDIRSSSSSIITRSSSDTSEISESRSVFGRRYLRENGAAIARVVERCAVREESVEALVERLMVTMRVSPPRGGLILWTCKEIKDALKGSPIDTLIRSCLLEERSGDASFNYDGPGASYTLRWTFHNELGLVFMAVYQRILHLLYVDDLLAMVKKEFSQVYDPKRTVYDEFGETFKQLRIEAEARAEELRKSNREWPGQ